MKKLLAVLIMSIATHAFASRVDSGKCPWKLPFIFRVSAKGVSYMHGWSVPTHGHGYDSSWSVATTREFGFVVDTTPGRTSAPWDTLPNRISTLSITNNTLRYTTHYSSKIQSISVEDSSSLIVKFVPGKDSIESLTFDQRNISGYQNTSTSSIATFSISHLAFDDSSIFTGDSTIAMHDPFLHDRKMESEYWEFPLTEFGSFTTTDFTAESFDLSGIFRPVHFAEALSVGKPRTRVNVLEVSPAHGSLRCSFTPRVTATQLEIYSTLGIMTRSIPINPGVSEVNVGRLETGFYLLRLGSTLAKVYVAE